MMMLGCCCWFLNNNNDTKVLMIKINLHSCSNHICSFTLLPAVFLSLSVQSTVYVHYKF